MMSLAEAPFLCRVRLNHTHLLGRTRLGIRFFHVDCADGRARLAGRQNLVFHDFIAHL